MVSSWKLETSRTMTVFSLDSATNEIAGVPMLPPTATGRPPAARISPASVVVVVLPFDPVMATIGPERFWAASSISPITDSPRERACTSGAASTGTPGLTTIRSCPRNVRSPWPPVSTAMPWSRSRGISSRSWSGDFVSETVTRAPRAFRNSADATPDLPSPTTSTRLSLTSTEIQFLPQSHRDTEKTAWALLRASLSPWWIAFLPQLQGREREQSKDQRCDPEAHDHLRLRPTQKF